MRHTHRSARAAAVLAVFLATPAPVAATEWSPAASDRLVRLPAAYLERAIKRDFDGSPLAEALRLSDQRISDSSLTVEELGRAADAARDETAARELRHRTLVEKRAYVALMGERVDLRRRRLDTEIRLLKALARKLERQAIADGDIAAEVEAGQARAMERFERSRAVIDTRLMKAGLAPESRYAEDYNRNLTAIERLAAAIEAHPANREASGSAHGLSKPEQVRRMIAQAESAQALLDQEEQVLGLMAKLVSLDALSFADEVAESMDAPPLDGGGRPADLATAADLFIRQ